MLGSIDDPDIADFRASRRFLMGCWQAGRTG
jgi:hypothetical protein